MKNRIGKAAGFLFALLLLAGTVFASAGGPFVQKAQAAEGEAEAYSYYVFIYSGKEGYFGSPENRVIKEGPFSYGTPYSVSMASLGLALENEDQYYARGLKIAGHDNDEIGQGMIQSYTFPDGITEDVSLSVAYGMRGGMVQYTVNYVEADTGEELYPTEVFYGMVGDKPVVSYQYVEGYRPNAYNMGKTLVEDESRNVFTFTYTRLPEGETEIIYETEGESGTTVIVEESEQTELEETVTAGTETTGDTETAAGTETTGETGTTGTAGTAEGTGNTGRGQESEAGNVTAEPENTEPQSYIDLDDEETPLGNISLDDGIEEPASVSEEHRPEGGFSYLTILPYIIIATAAVIFLLILFWLMKKRKEESE